MKALLMVALVAASFGAWADQYVQPYFKKDGTYVEGHYRSSPNATRSDNYSSQGNSNPYTGQKGSQRNEYSDPPAYNKTNPYVYQPYSNR